MLFCNISEDHFYGSGVRVPPVAHGVQKSAVRVRPVAPKPNIPGSSPGSGSKGEDGRLLPCHSKDSIPGVLSPIRGTIIAPMCNVRVREVAQREKTIVFSLAIPRTQSRGFLAPKGHDYCKRCAMFKSGKWLKGRRRSSSPLPFQGLNSGGS